MTKIYKEEPQIFKMKIIAQRIGIDGTAFSCGRGRKKYKELFDFLKELENQFDEKFAKPKADDEQ